MRFAALKAHDLLASQGSRRRCHRNPRNLIDYNNFAKENARLSSLKRLRRPWQSGRTDMHFTLSRVLVQIPPCGRPVLLDGALYGTHTFSEYVTEPLLGTCFRRPTATQPTRVGNTACIRSYTIPPVKRVFRLYVPIRYCIRLHEARSYVLIGLTVGNS